MTSAAVALTASCGVSLDGFDRVVVVVPHPDDESLSTGVLLAEAAASGTDVRVIAVTDGEAAYPGVDLPGLAAIRCAEQRAALEVLGVRPGVVVRLRIPDGEVGDHVDALERAIRAQLTAGTLLVAPSVCDWHPDHEACGVAARRASSTGPRWSSLFWAHHHPQRLLASRAPLVALSGDAEQIERRRRAIACHRSQFSAPAGVAPILTSGLLGHLDVPHELFAVEP